MNRLLITSLFLGLLLLNNKGFSQNIGINAAGTLPNNSAGLDVDFTNKGMLVPRIALTSALDATTITSPATSLLIYNTATAGVSPNNVTPGYYYWSGAAWTKLATVGAAGTDWTITGNTGTNPTTNFIGTTDNQDLVVKSNNNEVMRVKTSGRIGINENDPSSSLLIRTYINADLTNPFDGVKLISPMGSPFYNSGTMLGIESGSTTGFMGRSAQLWNFENGFLRFGTSNVERMRIDQFGSIGINEPNAISTITMRPFINGPTGAAFDGIRIIHPVHGPTTTDGLILGVDAAGMDASLTSYQLGNLTFGTQGNERMRITPTGTVAIGVSNPSSTSLAQLVLQDNSTFQTGMMVLNPVVAPGTQGFLFGLAPSLMGLSSGKIWNYMGGDIEIGTNNMEVMRVSRFGRVGINNATPSYDLDVNGDGNFSGPLKVTNYTLPNGDGAMNQVIQTDGSGNLSWANGATGTVTSVDLFMPSLFTVAGGPITSSGSFNVGLSTQPSNTVFAGPSFGAASAPSFRALVAADIPTLTGYIQNNIVNDNFGTGQPGSFDITGDGEIGGTLEVNGNVGIGTINPTEKLEVNGKIKVGTYTLPSTDGFSSQVLKTNGAGTLTWSNDNSGTGTVTSVALSMPTIFNVSGSPVTTSGTLTSTLANQNANMIFAGPGSGAATTPSFRTLVAADIPTLTGYIQNAAVGNNFATGQAASFDITGNAEVGGTLEVNGNVGIGTTTPNQQLEITANFRLPSSTPTAGIIYKGTNSFIHNYSGDFFGGINAGNFTSTGYQNVGVGNSTLNDNVTGRYNVAVGSQALTSNTDAEQNTAVGFTCLTDNTTGAYNTGIGAFSLSNNITGADNCALGKNACYYNTTGSNNVAIGSSSLANNTIGYSNTAIGNQALWQNVAGNFATAVGANAMSNINSTATAYDHYNVALGYNALRGNFPASGNTGNYNTALGSLALMTNSTGNSNTVIGYLAGYTTIPANANTTGSNNTFIGYNSGPGTTTQLTNATALGSNALVSANNSLVLGGTGASAVNVGIGITVPTAILDVTNASGAGTLEMRVNSNGGSDADLALKTTATNIGIYGGGGVNKMGVWNYATSGELMTILGNGDVGIGCTTPTAKLHVNGAIRSTVIINTAALACSDRRYKHTILPLENSLSQIQKMRGVTYYWKKDEFKEMGFTNEKQIGFIAQELEQIFPELVHTDETGYKSVDYSKVTPILVEAIKEQQKQLDEQKSEMSELKKQVDLLLKKVEGPELYGKK